MTPTMPVLSRAARIQRWQTNRLRRHRLTRPKRRGRNVIERGSATSNNRAASASATRHDQLASYRAAAVHVATVTWTTCCQTRPSRAADTVRS
jgi:hypothetical protein